MNAPTPDPMLRMTPQKASARMVPVDEPTEREVTPAVRRATDEMSRLYGVSTVDAGIRVLVAALDVEEMARALWQLWADDHAGMQIRPWDEKPDGAKWRYRREATALRVAILGGAA